MSADEKKKFDDEIIEANIAKFKAKDGKCYDRFKLVIEAGNVTPKETIKCMKRNSCNPWI